jgi:hypothetical protein
MLLIGSVAIIPVLFPLAQPDFRRFPALIQSGVLGIKRLKSVGFSQGLSEFNFTMQRRSSTHL